MPKRIKSRKKSKRIKSRKKSKKIKSRKKSKRKRRRQKKKNKGHLLSVVHGSWLKNSCCLPPAKNS